MEFEGGCDNMLRISEVEEYVKSLVPAHYYMYAFPTTAVDACVVILMNGGEPATKSNVLRPTLQFLVRGAPNDSQGAEEMAIKLFEEFKFKEDFMIGSTSIVEMSATTSHPLWTGADEANRPIFSMNFKIVTR